MEEIDANPGLDDKQQSKLIMDSIDEELRGIAKVGWDGPNLPTPGHIFTTMDTLFAKTKSLETDGYDVWDSIFTDLKQRDHQTIVEYVSEIMETRTQFLQSADYEQSNLKAADSALARAFSKRCREPFKSKIGELMMGWKSGKIQGRPKTPNETLNALARELMTMRDLEKLKKKKQNQVNPFGSKDSKISKEQTNSSAQIETQPKNCKWGNSCKYLKTEKGCRFNHESANEPPIKTLNAIYANEHQKIANELIIKTVNTAVKKALNAEKICTHCDRKGHLVDKCWAKYPELNPRKRQKRD
jgi:hypothetical protein